jgi:hypothetical protein
MRVFDCDRRAWHPQVNGVVCTLTSLARSASALGAEIDFLTPDGFPSLGVPTYPGLRMALPNRREIAARVEAVSPDAVHVATEGPIGWAVRAYCRRRKLAFTTSYTTRSPEIHRGTIDRPGDTELRRAATFSCGSRHDDGRHLLAQARTQRKRFQEAWHLDARCRHRPVHARRCGRA